MKVAIITCPRCRQGKAEAELFAEHDAKVIAGDVDDPLRGPWARGCLWEHEQSRLPAGVPLRSRR